MATTLIKIIVRHLKTEHGPRVSPSPYGDIHIAKCIGPDPSICIITAQISHNNSQGTVSLWLWGTSIHDNWREERYNASDPELLTKLTNEIQHHHDNISTNRLQPRKDKLPASKAKV